MRGACGLVIGDWCGPAVPCCGRGRWWGDYFRRCIGQDRIYAPLHRTHAPLASHPRPARAPQAFRRRALTYDRVSPKQLSSATLVDGDRIKIGACTYHAVLLDPIEACEPALLAKLVALAEAGVQILSLGGLPDRAIGWRDHEKRDEEVKALVRRLQNKVSFLAKTSKKADVPVGMGCCGMLKHVTGLAAEAAIHDIEILLSDVFGEVVEPMATNGEDFGFSIERRATAEGDVSSAIQSSPCRRCIGA